MANHTMHGRVLDSVFTYMQKACKRMDNCMQIAFEKIYYVFFIGWHTIWKMSEKENENQDPTWRIFHTSCCLMRASNRCFCVFVRRFSALHLFLYCVLFGCSAFVYSLTIKLQIAFIDPIVDEKQQRVFGKIIHSLSQFLSLNCRFSKFKHETVMRIFFPNDITEEEEEEESAAAIATTIT